MKVCDACLLQQISLWIKYLVFKMQVENLLHSPKFLCFPKADLPQGSLLKLLWPFYSPHFFSARVFANPTCPTQLLLLIKSVSFELLSSLLLRPELYRQIHHTENGGPENLNKKDFLSVFLTKTIPALLYTLICSLTISTQNYSTVQYASPYFASRCRRMPLLFNLNCIF